MSALKLLANIYMAVTATYGTVYLSCLVVPKHIEEFLWYVTVDHYSSPTFATAAIAGGIWTAARRNKP